MFKEKFHAIIKRKSLSLMVRLGLGGGLLLAVAACFLPVKFDAEITIDRGGYYTMIFSGYLADVTLYSKIKDASISPADEQVYAEQLVNGVLAGNVEGGQMPIKTFNYFKDGIFEVLWERSGDLLKSKRVTFLRGNENMLSLQYEPKTGLIKMEGAYIPRTAPEPTKFNPNPVSQLDQLRELGLNMQGQIRVKTDKRMVISDNASQTHPVEGDSNGVWLIWDVKNLAADRPVMTLRIH